ncbi:hypothetical protein KSF_025060 [Reticulibacter mediterranei]|uniref:PTS sucrose transporter subunit IIBC n=1 Tax=Reticulibacter mediterranei TaxID=2778369 RepID=A0A8J3IH66_9CHLR|nr:PTS sucrose transporter subunit IIBC [Reticulibacter mediterranei]GHO92458.1 hypothetical protein KSF_025060 [Reticulibacter mediterranei]
MPAFNVNIGDPIFIGAFFGFLISLPVSLFLAFWLSAVKKRAAVVIGAFVGALLGLLILLGWAGTLIYDQPLPGANGGSVFFGSLFFCTVLGLSGGILTDLLIARKSRRDYLRATAQEHNG